MKVTNKSIGGTSGQIEAGKTGKGEATRGAKGSAKIDSAKGGAPGGSKVDVSERAQMMQKAKEIASDQSIDEAKVAHFQKLIDSGKYQVDADKIADKLVDDHMLIPD